MKRLLKSVVLGVLSCGSLALPARAEVKERVIPLNDGQVSVEQLVSTLGKDLGAPAIPLPFSTIDLRGDNATRFCRQLTDALAPGCRAVVEGGALCVRVDRSAIPGDAWAMRRTTRLLLTGNAATPKSDRHGLLIPAQYDPAKPLVVLIHGLDSDNHMWGTMVKLLQQEGYQVGSFAYPDDGPIAESGMLLADGLADWRMQYPAAKPVSIIAHSMGGLVARHYVEGVGYRGGVERLIMLGTPNHGSTWTGWRWATEWNSQYKVCQRDGNWTWSKLTEDGNGEAATDLQPGSALLTSLNAQPRRKGVQYTIVAGNRSAVREVGADWVACTADWMPKNVWGLRQAQQSLVAKAEELHKTAAECDGPVTIESAKLDGVADFVVVTADHTGLACGQPPAAWDIIRERLKAKE
ncbi:esterase/lipase family protein [Humisphaera borealis]|uniref:GPI inositol-deacylase PGAP1-like alpha/beta domain-containing protein n=1 Tax=Humisphaera borealis TaxID=2807512 RepID=A0A7M2X2M8_9BACT|nr:hypothetical protein [Humisphaera borealis]QOV91869.1 hypothetical protein IPV69_11150 [Humisphaera borealis]